MAKKVTAFRAMINFTSTVTGRLLAAGEPMDLGGRDFKHLSPAQVQDWLDRGLLTPMDEAGASRPPARKEC